MLVESEVRERAYRFVAYSAVTFSLTAIIAVFITLPMVNNYVNSVQSRVQMEMDFCKISAKEVMLEMHEFRATPRAELPSFLRLSHNNGTFRAKRQTAQCEGCCLPGGPGPSGAPGSARKSLSHHACRARLENPDRQVRLGIPEIRDPSGIQVVQETTGLRAPKDHLDQTDRPENPAGTDRGETLDDRLFRLQRFPATQEHPESRDHQDFQERQENQDGQDPKDNRDRKDRQGHQASLDHPVIRPKYCALDGGVFFEDGTRR